MQVSINQGNRGFALAQSTVITFEVEGLEAREDIRSAEYDNIYARYAGDNACVNIQGFWVPMWGDTHNLYPQEVYSLVSENKLLPSIIEKQIKFLFGKGPYLYREVVIDGRLTRQPVDAPHITAWLSSWEDAGLPGYIEYLYNLISDFYHVRTCVTRYHFTRARRVGAIMPVMALSYIGADEARLAAIGEYSHQRIRQQQCNHILVGNWLQPSSQFEVFPRFSPSQPFQYPTAVAFNSVKTFSRWVYAYNEWFRGLYEWIKASNLTPRYLNSYLRNALNAHVHVRIPGTWYAAQKSILENICLSNLQSDPNTPIQTEYRGVSLTDEHGRPYRFFDAMMDDLITHELRRITELMSGEGRNQGKLYATVKYGDEGWQFEEFPGKFKDYFESVIDYDKRADQVILAGKGISSSITNVENDGVISKSGSDVYYNYVIYLASLTYDELFVCRDINRAIALNFPDDAASGVKLGFWIDIPDKMQEISPANRLPQTLNPKP